MQIINQKTSQVCRYLLGFYTQSRPFSNQFIEDLKRIVDYSEETDHSIPWQTDQAFTWRTSSASAIEALCQK
jgi:hypothetical protein